MALLMAGCMCCSRATVVSCSRVRSDPSIDSNRKWLPVQKQLSSMSDALMCSAGMAQAGDWLDSCAACCMSLRAHEATAGSCSASLPGSCSTGCPSGPTTTHPVCPGRGRRVWRRFSLSKLRALWEGRLSPGEQQPGIAGQHSVFLNLAIYKAQRLELTRSIAAEHSEITHQKTGQVLQ